MPLLDGGAGQRVDLDAAGDGRLALLADGLALARAERGKEIVEAGVAVIFPVELLAGALQETGGAEALPLAAQREGDVQRGYFVAARQLDHRRDQRVGRLRIGTRTDQQTRTRHRSEWHRALQLGIISAAGALIGGGPGMIEDVLAVGMALEIKRRGADQPPARILEREMLRQPTVLRGRRAAFLERLEEIMREERIAGAGAGIPFGSRQLGDAIDDADGEGAAAVRHCDLVERCGAAIPPTPTLPRKGQGNRI